MLGLVNEWCTPSGQHIVLKTQNYVKCIHWLTENNQLTGRHRVGAVSNLSSKKLLFQSFCLFFEVVEKWVEAMWRGEGGNAE